MVGPRGVADGQSCAVTAVAATDAAASARPRHSLAGHHSIAITTATTASCGVADNAGASPHRELGLLVGDALARLRMGKARSSSPPPPLKRRPRPSSRAPKMLCGARPVAREAAAKAGAVARRLSALKFGLVRMLLIALTAKLAVELSIDAARAARGGRHQGGVGGAQRQRRAGGGEADGGRAAAPS